MDYQRTGKKDGSKYAVNKAGGDLAHGFHGFDADNSEDMITQVDEDKGEQNQRADRTGAVN